MAGEAGPTAAVTALGTARGSFLRGWRLLAIDGFETDTGVVDVADSDENAALEASFHFSGLERF